MTASVNTLQAYQAAELRSECIRITALLSAFAALLLLLLFRGATALAAGHRGETWPFAVLLGCITAYEVVWLRLVRRTIIAGGGISQARWAGNIFVESLLPTGVLLLQAHTLFPGPSRVLTSPGVLLYFLLIILSTLHVNRILSLLSGVVSAAGYGAVSLYTLFEFPEAAEGGALLVFGTLVSTAALLLLGGFAAGSVATQIRQYMVAAVRDAENRAKVERLEHDLNTARSIQQGLLPQSAPRMAGFDVAGWNQPADETGGDYFDWQELEDGRLAITIADVTGHGIGPALCMSACRAYARAVLATESDLQSFLACLNRLLCQDLPPEKFVTLAVGLLNPLNATLQLISAGHGPIVHYSAAENRFRSYDAQGVPLGLMMDYSWSGPHLLKFAPGDIFVVVTDGFVEWANANDEEFGLSRLKEVIRIHHRLPSSQIISQLYSSVTKFVGSAPQFDDLTVLLIKRL